MKIAALILLAVSTSVLTACFPANFAQNSQAGDAKTSENKRESSVTNAEKAEAENSVKQAQALSTPKPKIADNFVCPEPNLPCNHKQKQFETWELSFRLPVKIVSNKSYKSAPFYAIILKTYLEGCSELDIDPKVEEERIEIQKLFPSRKVFSQNSCANLSAVNYEFAGKRDKSGERDLYMDFTAVYAGVTEAEGREIFDLIRGDYPQAELKKMTAVYEMLEF